MGRNASCPYRALTVNTSILSIQSINLSVTSMSDDKLSKYETMTGVSGPSYDSTLYMTLGVWAACILIYALLGALQTSTSAFPLQLDSA